MDPRTLAVCLLCAVSVLAPAIASIDWRTLLRRRRALRRHPDAREGDVRTVWGKIAPLRTVVSPIDGLRCAAAWTVVEGRDRRGRRVRVRLATAADFLLESPEGRFMVRTDGFRFSERYRADMPLRVAPEGAIRAAIDRAGLDLGRSTYYAEMIFVDSEAVGVTGEWRLEPVAEGLAVFGYRAACTLPTLRARGGVLGVERLVRPEETLRVDSAHAGR